MLTDHLTGSDGHNQKPLDPVPFDGLLDSWCRSLVARNRSKNTIYSYRLAAELLERFLTREGLPTKPGLIERGHVEAFVADQLAHGRPSTAAIRYRSLKQFFRWLVEEDEIDRSPMTAMSPPSVPEVPVPVVDSARLSALFALCEGRSFADRRDTAILRLFVETPCRLSEVALLDVADVDLDERLLRVTAKGNRVRLAPFGALGAQALDRYLRVRRTHSRSESAALWLGERSGGPMTPNGVAQVLRRRCRQGGIDPLHWHQFRHTFAHEWLAEGGGEESLMRLAGWRSRVMLQRYGASVADERAREEYRRRRAPKLIGGPSSA